MGLVNAEANISVDTRLDVFAKGVNESLAEYQNSYFLEYLESCEKFLHKTLFASIMEIDECWLATRDFNKIDAVYQKSLSLWEKAFSRCSVKATQKERARLHIIKNQHHLSDWNYREILLRVTGKLTCAQMNHYEIMLAIRGLQMFVNGKLTIDNEGTV